jgi:beta-glucosidase
MDTNTKEFPWMDTSLSPKERASLLVANMDLDQKINQLHGAMATIDIYATMDGIEDDEGMEKLAEQIQVERHVDAIDALGIPRYRITNGPVGVGMGDGIPSPKATALPMTIGVVASFDPNLAYTYGDIIGEETFTLGQHVLEGPAVCLHRLPISGRNFEYFSEDPYLSGVMGVEITKAIQSHDVIAMGKHFAVNDQEDERFRYSVEIDENVLRELYLLPFEMLVKDGEVAAIMSAYNRVRGTYATENRYLLNDILRKEWGFDGYVQSDFWSARSAAGSLNAGMDHEMPDAKWLNETNIKAALADQSLEEATIDRALIRRFTQMFKFNVFGREYNPGAIDAKANGARARRIGEESAVLLKNDKGLLPLDPTAHDNVLIVGLAKFAQFATQGGGGSSKVDPLYTVAPAEGMTDVLADLGSSTTVDLFVVADDLSNLNEAKDAVAAADAVVIMAGLVATEGADMKTPHQPKDQDTMVDALLGINDHTVVVLKDSTPVVLPWIDQADAVLEVWNQGVEDGHVVADLVFGRVNPSGKVPTTYPARDEDMISYGHEERYPGVNEGEGFPTIHYSEGLEMGYRWYQGQGVKPVFAFGHGLSYTTFDISNVAVDQASSDGHAPINISATVTNTGDREGAEVVQVYVGIPVDGQPPMRLVGFQKVNLQAGEHQDVVITIDPFATNHPLSVWDDAAHDFVVEAGDYEFYVGNASDNIIASLTHTIQ